MNKLFLSIVLLTPFLPPIHTLKPWSDTSKLKFINFRISAEMKVAPNLYTTQTGFFCNTERALEKKTKVAIKFRLGSVEQTQQLEGYGSTLPSSHR